MSPHGSRHHRHRHDHERAPGSLASPRRRARRAPAHPAAALEAAGLDWTVAKEPLFRASGHVVAGHHATVREDTDGVLGVVSDDYVVVQNRDCFAFLANLLGSG